MSTQDQPQAATGFVIVGCKLPNGLKIELLEKVGDSSTKDYRTRVVGSHVLKGANAARIVGGYGLTEGVPEKFMNEWLKRNAHHPAVVGKQIFIHTKADSAIAQAKEQRELRTGLEAIDPSRDGKRFGIEMDATALKEYDNQKRQNPAAGRTISE